MCLFFQKHLSSHRYSALLAVFRVLGFKRRATKKPKKLLIFTLPSKTTLRETKLTVILMSVVVFHILLNLPHNVCTIFYSIMDDFWMELKDDTRQYLSNVVRPIFSL